MVVAASLLTSACYRDSLQVWLYSQPCSRRLFSEDMIDMEKPYDAFISYSQVRANLEPVRANIELLLTLYPQADSDYVEQQLLPGLETPSDAASPRLE